MLRNGYDTAGDAEGLVVPCRNHCGIKLYTTKFVLLGEWHVVIGAGQAGSHQVDGHPDWMSTASS